MTGLRINTEKLRKRLRAFADKSKAEDFRPELVRFASRTLADCIQATPVRALSVIEANQRKQYERRINYIPSYHELEDPSLIVNDQGEEWIYAFGKWYNAQWNLKDEVWGAYMDLAQERARRMATLQSDFVNGRAQARFLFQRSWWQVAQSLGIALSVAAAIIDSRSRKKPAKAPSKAYGQWRGGKSALSIVIFNPFLSIAGKYWKGNGKSILDQATVKNRARFYKECSDKMKRSIAEARRT